MEWLIIITVSLIFCAVSFRLGYIRGYKAGAKRVVDEWRSAINYNYSEEDTNV